MHTATIDMSSAASDDSEWSIEVTDSDLMIIEDAMDDDDDAPTIRQEIPSFLRNH
jgi:hypothetical protein